MLELAQITCEESPGGKLTVDKDGGGDSPNLAAAFMMATAPRKLPLVFTDADVRAMES